MGRINYRPGMYRYVYNWFWYHVQQCTGWNADGTPKFEEVARYRDGDYARKRVYELNGWKLREGTNG